MKQLAKDYRELRWHAVHMALQLLIQKVNG